ncbi:MAG: response regulator transcription factor [Rubripirellula sp.]
MSIPLDTTLALVYVVDRDAESKNAYQAMAERLGVELRFSTSVEPLLAIASSESPSCLIYDVGSVHEDSEQWRRDLMKQTAELPLILLADPHSEANIAMGISAGALAVLRRPTPMNVLEQHLQFAIHRQRSLSALNQKFVGIKHTLEDLTVRQQKVLDLAATGMPNKTIASRLSVSQRTVETERAKVLKIFSAESFCDVTAQVGAYRVLDTLNDLKNRETLLRQGIYPAPQPADDEYAKSQRTYQEESGDERAPLMLMSDDSEE